MQREEALEALDDICKIVSGGHMHYEYFNPDMAQGKKPTLVKKIPSRAAQ